MAPVEPARAAAVAVVAVVGVALTALAVTKLKSVSKKRSSGKESGSSSEEAKSAEDVQTKELDLQPKVQHEETKIKTSGREAEVPKAKQRVDSCSTINGNSTAKASSLKSTSQTRPAEESQKLTPQEQTGDSSGLLVKQVYKAEDEPSEQTLVSFAEIHFSPSKSAEAEKGLSSPHDGRILPEPRGNSNRDQEKSPIPLSDHLSTETVPVTHEKTENEIALSFEAISVSSACREDNGQKVEDRIAVKKENHGQNSDESTSENNKSDTSFETVEVGQDGMVEWTETGKVKTGVGADDSSVHLPPDLIAQAGGAKSENGAAGGVAYGAGESLALSVEGDDDGAIAGITSMAPAEAGGDSSFVLLDVATAPSNCKPAVDIVESVPLDQLELQQSVSLQRLKSSGSDPDGAQEDALQTDTPDSVESDPYPDLSENDISEALNIASARPEDLELKHAHTLVKMLSTRDLELQEKILAVIAKVGAFTKSQDLMREAGCIPRLISLLKTHSAALQIGLFPFPRLLLSLINAVTNLAVNTINNAMMQDCVPFLVDLTLSETGNENVQTSSLQALTNLSVTVDHHPLYTRVVQKLFDLVDSSVPNVQLQSLKVLVNLSCNKEMIPQLLAVKAPGCLLSLLETDTRESAVLRWTTLLANIMHTVKDQQLSSTELPPDDKAASPETMYIALYGLNTSGQLRNKVFVLSKHPNEDIRYQAARIYSGLMR